jgi:hypothetical protein
MRELEVMMDWDKKPDDNKTYYMGLSDFRNRKVLPSPDALQQ